MNELGALGRYTLLRRLAAGGMGEVYLAETQGAANFTRRVAIKRILPHLARDSDFVRKFIDEANLMVQLHHGNIVPVMELADHDGELYLVMEYLPGRDLKTVIRALRAAGRLMPHELAMWLVAEILAGLDYAHRKHDANGLDLHIVHRDVSPSNVCLGAGGEVKLIDFGIARARGGLHQSISGTLQGKFVYMSPEQADGQSVDPRSDIFSAGLLLYELLTAVRPFEADTETAVLRKVREAKIEPPSSLASDIPPEVDALVLKALERSPDARFATAGEMRRALSHTLADARSEADAAALSEFLRELFPDGVVPKGGPAGPLSLDAALQMQLGALTPSASERTRTRTRTGPEQRPLRDPAMALAPTATGSTPGALNPRSTPGAGTTSPTFTQPTITQTARPKGFRRSVFLGLLLGVVATIGVVALLQPNPATVQIQTQPPVTTLRTTVDGVELGPKATLPAGESRQICAHAPGFQASCRYVTLRPGANTLRFELSEQPLLIVRLDPPEAEAEINVNQRHIKRFPLKGLRIGQSAEILVKPGTDWEVELEQTTIIEVRPGENIVEFSLLRRPQTPPDAGPDAALPAPDARVVASQPAPPRRTHRAQVKLQTIPAAKLKCSDGTAGPAPQTITTSRRSVRCTASAAGHVSKTTTIRPKDTELTRTLRLDAFARFSARAYPGAASIYLDGKRLSGNSISNHAVPPGTHTLQARLSRAGTVVKSSPVKFTLAPGETNDDAILLRVPKPGVPP